MSDVTVKMSDIKVVRESLALPLFELIAHMTSMDWDFSLSMPDEHDGFVSFSKSERWHDRHTLACNCRYGYRFEKADEETVTKTAQRAAELCLTVYETFIELIPGTPNIYGIIRPDIIVNKERFSQETYEEFKLRHQSLDFREVAHPLGREQGVSFRYHRHHVSIDNEEIPSLREQLDRLRRKLDGTSAFDC